VYVLDPADEALAGELDALAMRAVVVPTLMKDPVVRAGLAAAVFA
jgi:hypothetical protein